jgi:hypothetical protein
MRVHSEVGLITNSSSETYTRVHNDYEETLYAIGQDLLDALGVAGDSREVFEVVKEVNANGKDRLLDIEEGTELPLNSENWCGYESSNYDVFLVVRATGAKLDFERMAGSFCTFESCYNG